MKVELQPEFPHRTRRKARLEPGAPRRASVPYVELHAHSSYSFLDGTSLPEELAVRAAELGYPALALTDHDGVYGSLEFAHAAKHFGVRPITGAELTLADHSHVTLLVETPKGYANLCRLITSAHAQTRRPGRESQPPADPALEQSMLEELSEGLVCLSGCARHGVAVRSPNAAARLARVFGSERFFIELQRPYERGDARRNAGLRDLADMLGVPTIATGDVHAHHRRRAPLQDVLVAVRHRSSLDGCEAERRGNHECVLLSPVEMVERFPEDREAVARTVELADRLQFDLTEELGYHYPDFSDSPEPAIVQLAQVCNRAFEDRYPNGHKLRRKARSRLEDELRLIDELGLAGFFLLHWDVLELARECALEVRGRDSPRHALPPGRGRGSSVGSLVCYLTGLSHVDPVDAELSLGRFLNRELDAVPDIDLDFPRDIREKLIVAVTERYGREQAALAALARVRRAVPGDRRPAAPHLAAPRRDGDLVTAARRARPGAAGRDGGQADVPVGQGLVRGRGIPEDRPARSRDAVRGRGLCRPGRKASRGADRSVQDPSRRPRCLRRHPVRGHDRRLPDREPCADAEPPADAAGEPRRSHSPGGARPAGTDPGEGRPPVHRAPPAPARGALVRPARRPPSARRLSELDARRRRLPGPGARGGECARGIQRGGGGGPSPRDEPQALTRRAGGVSRALRRGRTAEGRPGRDGRPGLRQARRVLRLRLPEVACGGVRAARVPVRVAAASPPRGVPVRVAERATDGVLSAGDARPRRAAARSRDASARRECQRREVHRRRRRGAHRHRLRERNRRGGGEGRRGGARTRRTIRHCPRPCAADAASGTRPRDADRLGRVRLLRGAAASAALAARPRPSLAERSRLGR